MKSKLYLLPLLVFILSCQQSPDFKKLETLPAIGNKINPQESYIYSDISFSISEIENEINRKLKSVLHEDKEYQNRDGVRMKVKIEKTDRILIKSSAGGLNFTLPVKISGRILIDEKLFGVSIKAEPGFNLTTTIVLHSDFLIENDLRINIQTKIKEIRWPVKPEIKAGPLKIDLSKPLESVILNNEKSISDLIQKQSDKLLDIENKIRNSDLKIPKYNLVNKKDAILWMKLNPERIIVERKPRIISDTINLRLGLEIIMEVKSNNGDSSFIDLTDIPIVSSNELPEQFNIHMIINLSFRELDSLLGQKLPQLNDSLEKNDLRLSKLRVGSYSDDAIWLNADLEGKLNSSLFINGKITFDSLDKSIKLGETNLVLYNSDLINQIALYFFGGGLKDNLKNRVKFPMEPLFKKVQIAVYKLFNKIAKDRDLELNLDNLGYKVNEIRVHRDFLEISVSVKGTSEFRLGIKSMS